MLKYENPSRVLQGVHAKVEQLQKRLATMGVKIVLNHKVTDLLAEQKAGQFDAVFVAIGAQAVQPDHRRALLGFHRMRDLRRKAGSQPQ